MLTSDSANPPLSAPCITDGVRERPAGHTCVSAVVRSEAGLRAIVEEWRDLQASCGAYVFTDPALVEAWWNVRGRMAGARLHIVTVRRSGRLVGLAPLAISRRHGLRFLRWAGTEVFDYCDVLATDADSAAALWRAIRRSRGYDLAFLKTILPDTATYRTLQQSAALVRSTQIFVVTLDGTRGHGQHWSGASTFRRKARRLAEAGMRYEILRTGPIPEPVLAALVAQKTAWATDQKKSGLFDDPQAAADILRDVAESFARMGVLHLSWLGCGDTIIAVQLGCVHRRRFYFYMASYDAAWSKLSPGTQLLASNLGWCVDEGVSEFDLLRGGDAYKAEIANLQRSPGDFLFAGSLLGRLAQPAVHHILSRASTTD